MRKLSTFIVPTFFLGCTALSPLEHSATAGTILERQRDMAPHTVQGFVLEEAKDLLEICIELNNQQGRNETGDPAQKAHPSAGWQIVYDSRNPVNRDWNVTGNTPELDAKRNGINPFNNAWLLAKKEPNLYAIAIRGTVGEQSSIKSDLYATTISANGGLAYPRGRYLPITFAATPKAEVHLGFAYGAFSLLFDGERGILRQLRAAKLPPDTKLLLTGHSQGAAIATLVHSFLFYAISDESDRFHLGIKSTGVSLKSYVFAQPKPGNLQYAADFARIAGGTGFVINNDLDPVPMVPLSLEFPSTDILHAVAEENKAKGSFIERLTTGFVSFKGKFESEVKSQVAARGAEIVAKLYDDKGVVLDTSYFKSGETVNPEPATSLNYTSVGQLVPVFGIVNGGDLYPPTDKNKTDPLLHHHSTSYRKLLDAQLTGRFPSAD